MNIKIWDDKYIVKADPRQYILFENNKKSESAVGYYNSMMSVFKSIIERESRNNKCTTLDGYIKHIEKVNKMLEKNLLKIEALVGKKKTMERLMFALPHEVDEKIMDIGEDNKGDGKKK